ncbi:hypothetical protein [Hamadaea tsunoensis]|uniref:hypothetical protein n=1 Tax=Hamadaea tsunoensis TaxID=53368 RepID=UPI0012FC461D|nr:hypothetical protein [Hamadaea tsunoensis]
MRRLFSLSVVAFLAIVLTPTPAVAVDYPGGRHIYTVALGAIPAPGVTSGPVWVRIAMYYFFGDGTVREGFWYWNRTQAVGAANTGVTSTGCDNCPVRTAAGFEGAGSTYYGTYTTTATQTVITWSNGSAETWNISHPSTDLARLDLASSNYDANVGWGFGSSASNNAFTTMADVPRKSYSGRYAGFNTAGGAGPSVMNLQDFQQCSTNCLSVLSAPSTACSACSSGNSSPIRYYLAGGGRKTYYEHWCQCLTSATCYTGGSHRKPMLEILGDSGTFHGWVGVEASNSAANTGYFTVFYHADV